MQLDNESVRNLMVLKMVEQMAGQRENNLDFLMALLMVVTMVAMTEPLMANPEVLRWAVGLVERMGLQKFDLMVLQTV